MPSNLTVLNQGSGGDVILDIDMANFTGYPLTSGKLEATAIYVGSGWTGAPQPLALFNPLPVQLMSGSFPAGTVTVPITSGSVQVSGIVGVSGQVMVTSGGILPVWIASGTITGVTLTSWVTSGSVQVSGVVGVSGWVISGSVQVSGIIGVSGWIISGSVIVSGNVGVSGWVTLLSGTAAIGQISSGGNPIGSVGILSGGVQVSGVVGVSGWIISGSVQVSGIVGVSGWVISGSVIVSGNVGVSGSVQLLSGSAWAGVVEGVYNPVPVSVSSGQSYPLQVDGSGGSLLVGGRYASGSPLSGQASYLSLDSFGQLRTTASLSPSPQQILSGSATIGVVEGMYWPVPAGVASGQAYPLQIDSSGASLLVGAKYFGAGVNPSPGSGQLTALSVDSTGNLRTTASVSVGSVQISSGSAWIGADGGVFQPVPVGVSSGQVFPLQIDGSGASLFVGGKYNPIAVTFGSGQLGGLQIDANGNLKTTATLSVTALQVSGTVAVSGIVGVSGWIISGSVQVSGIVGVSGWIISGSVIVSGNVGVSGSVQLLSGSAWYGAVEGVYQPVPVAPASGQAFPLQIDGSGASLIVGGVNSPILPAFGSGQKGSFQIDSAGRQLVAGIISGSVQVSGVVGVSGWIISGSVQVSGIIGVSGWIISGSVIVSGNVGVSGSVQLLSGSAWLGAVEGIFQPVPVGVSSGQVFPLQIDGSGASLFVGGKYNPIAVTFGSGQLGGFQIDSIGRLQTASIISGSVQVSGVVGVSGWIISGSVQVSGIIGVSGWIISGSVIVSGNVGISGSTQGLSGSAWLGAMEGVFQPVPVGVSSGQVFPLQIDASGASLLVGGKFYGGTLTPNIGSGQLAPLTLDGSGNLKVISIGGGGGGSAQISGAVIVSGIVGVSGWIISGSVIVSGNVGVSGSVQGLSGSAWLGAIEGVFQPVPVGVSSGQTFPLQIDGSGASLFVGGKYNPIGVTFGSGQLGGFQIDSAGRLQTASIVSGSVQISGVVGVSGWIISGSVQVSGIIGVSGWIISGSVIVSGNVGVSGSTQGLSGSAWLGAVEGIFQPVPVGVSSGQVFPLQVDGSGASLFVGGKYNPVSVTFGSGQLGGLQIDANGNLKTTASLSVTALQVSGTVSVSGIVGVSGWIISGSVIVSGNVGVSGTVQLASGNFRFGAPFQDVSGSASVSITTSGTTALLSVTQGCAAMTVAMYSGTGSGGAIQFQGTPDGISWFPINVIGAQGLGQLWVSGPTMGSTASGWIASVAGYQQVRAYVTSSGTGSVTIATNAGAGVSPHQIYGIATGSSSPNVPFSGQMSPFQMSQGGGVFVAQLLNDLWSVNLKQVGAKTLSLGASTPTVSLPINPCIDSFYSTTLDCTGTNTALYAPSSTYQLGGESTLVLQVTGTWTGTLLLEGTVDGSTWFTVPLVVPSTGTIVTSFTANGQWVSPVGGLGAANLRVRVSSAGTGSATLNFSVGVGASVVYLASPVTATVTGWTTSGSVQVSGIVGVSGWIISGSVIVSGNVNVSGSIQNLSGSAWMGAVEGVFQPVPVGVSSGQVFPLQVDGSGASLYMGGKYNPVNVTFGSGQLGGFQIDSNGRQLVAAVISGSVQISGAVQVSGIVGVSGWIISGSVIVSGNVNVSGTVQLLSGSAWYGAVEGVYTPVPVSISSGQPYALRLGQFGSLVVGTEFDPTFPPTSSGQVNPLIADGAGALYVRQAPIYPFRAYSGLTNTMSGIQIQSGAGRIMSVKVLNRGFSGIFLKYFDNSSGGFSGSTPILTFGVGQNEERPFQFPGAGVGWPYSLGLWCTVTQGMADTDVTNCSGLSGLVYAWTTIRSGT